MFNSTHPVSFENPLLSIGKLIQKFIDNKTFFSIYYIDIDDFKSFHYQHGYPYCDQFIKILSSALIKEFHNESVFYNGRDEFFIIRENNQNDHTFVNLLMQFIQKKWLVYNVSYTPTVSVGIAQFPVNGIDVYTLLRNAEISLSHSKKIGKSQYTYYKPQLEYYMKNSEHLGKELNRALDSENFELNFQPMFNLNTDEISAFDISFNWWFKGKCINPEFFVPFAEKTNQMIFIDKWVIHQSFNIISNYLNPIQIKFYFIRLSECSFYSNLLIDYIKKELEHTNIDPNQIIFLIDASKYTFIYKNAAEIIVSLKRMGFRFAIENIENRPALIESLNKSHISIIRINAKLINESNIDDFSQLIRQFYGKGMSVVFHNIENLKIYSTLKSHDNTYGQGNYLSVSLTLKYAEKMISN